MSATYAQSIAARIDRLPATGTIARTVTNIFLVNVGTSLLISVLFLGMLRWLRTGEKLDALRRFADAVVTKA